MVTGISVYLSESSGSDRQMSSFPSFIGYTSHFDFAYTTTFGFQVILLLPLPLLTSISIHLQQVRTHRSQIVRKKIVSHFIALNHLQRFQEIKDICSLWKVNRLQRSLLPVEFPVLVQIRYQ